MPKNEPSFGTAAGAMLLAAGLLGGCSAPPPKEAPRVDPAPAPFALTFVDATSEAGIAFRHQTGAFGRKWLPETMGSGCGWLDADGDGLLDLFLANGTTWPGHDKPGTFRSALYRNRGDGTFEDTTAKAGLDFETHGMGVAVGDYDNDGDADLFLSSVGPDHLLRNRGDGTFEDVTASAGLADPAFGSSATFLDYDRDGRLDLFVANYVEWSPETDLFCTLDGTHKSYCTPESYRGAVSRLYRNRGDGKFEDVTRSAGVFDEGGKALGVVELDENGDSLPDLAIARDTQPNLLYRNRGNGTFEEVGRHVGIAFSEAGAARAGMGIDASDYDDSGHESIVITNFSNEMIGLFHNEGKDLFVDDAARAGVGAPSLLTLGFGTFFFDADLDGRLDLFVANGHVEPDVQAVQRRVAYEQAPHLFHNLDGGRFERVAFPDGSALARPIVARGAAYADYDGDGDLDVVVTTNGGPAHLLRNDGGSSGDWLRVALVGTKSARDAYGARLALEWPGRRRSRTVRGGSSYLSQSESTATFGFGGSGKPERLVIRWPSGQEETVKDLPVRKTIVVTEGRGVTSVADAGSPVVRGGSR